jgi:peptidoglycan/LPS O-acetylase OafA/YrhL
MEDKSHARYLRPLDGLRAISVLAVIFYHLNARWLPGGYFGVDVFFVISGFLITGIIRRQLAEGTFSLRTFFSRRVRRIIPALAVVLGTTGLIFCWLDPFRAGQFSESIQRGLLMQGNLAARDAAGAYWGAAAADQPFLHIWSLGVEEQFYVMFPLLLVGLALMKTDDRSERKTATALAILCCGSFFWCCGSSFFWPESAFYLLPTRAWELLAGGLLAYALKGQQTEATDSKRGLAMTLAGGFLVLAAFVYAPFQLVFISVVPVIGAVLLIAGLHADHFASRVLAGEPLGFLGRISYSLYLWHWPIILLAAWPTTNALVPITPGWRELIALGATLLAATASFYLVERPLRGARQGVIVALAMSATVFFGIGWASARLGPTPLRSEAQIESGEFPKNPGGFPLFELRGGLYDSNPKMRNDPDLKKAPFKVVRSATPVPVGTPVRRLALNGNKRLVCWGDSHAMMLAPVLDEFAVGAGYQAEFHVWHGGDPAMDRPRSRFGDNAMVGWLKDAFAGEGATQVEAASFERCGKEMIQSGPEAVVFVMRYHDRDFSRYAATFDAILAKSRLIFVQQPPVLPIGEGFALNYFAAQRDLYGKNLDMITLFEGAEAQNGRRRFEEAIRLRYAGASNFRFLNTAAIFTAADGTIRWRTPGNDLLYLDDDHITEEGAQLIVRELAPLLK